MLDVNRPGILIINGGSSSVRFAVYGLQAEPQPMLLGKIDGIGRDRVRLTAKNLTDNTSFTGHLEKRGHLSVAEQLLMWLEAKINFSEIKAVGHRVVHGMDMTDAQLVTPVLLAQLQGLVPYDSEHLPLEIAFIKAFLVGYPDMPQIACFDTAFHQTMPRVASQLPLPRHYEAQGIRRYGFHGLSCEYLVQKLRNLEDCAAISERVIIAHLGNGASITAVKDGKSIDNTMGFTPSGGIMMGTRSGDLDPGLVFFLSNNEELSSEAFYSMINRESGLLGVSTISSDMRVLLEQESDDDKAAEAIALFCYQVTKAIGAYCATLGGLDTLIFSGGIGENSPPIRQRICANIGFLGVEIDQKLNRENSLNISVETSRVNVLVIPSNEEIIIAQSVLRILNLGNNGVCS
ncbi:acetate/propionate family kinase [Simiduia litorea]|uniref:acetate/propionate family kinase n=1 Tax=Simiduia litorea TaxID=1435348 RepID=UPI0036F36F46